MIGRRAIVGLSLLCALVFCAFAAPSAVAELKGTTAFTCAPAKEGAGFSDEHCTKAVTKEAKFKHDEIAPNKATVVEITNEKTESETTKPVIATLKSTIGGLPGDFVCKKVSGEATLTNEPPVEVEKKVVVPMKIAGSKINTTFSECEVKEPEKQECKITGGEVKVKGATSTTPTETMSLEFKPEAGKPFATFKLEKCKTAGLNIEYKVEGTATAIPDTPSGATLKFTEASTKGKVNGKGEKETLFLNGQSAFFTSTVTLRMKEVVEKEARNPISITTTEP